MFFPFLRTGLSNALVGGWQFSKVRARIVVRSCAPQRRSETPATWQAHDFFMRASATLETCWSSISTKDLYETRRLAERPLAIDPMYARAHTILAATHLTAWIIPLDSDDRAHQLASKAVQLDPNLPQARTSLGTALVFKRQHRRETDSHHPLLPRLRSRSLQRNLCTGP